MRTAFVSLTEGWFVELKRCRPKRQDVVRKVRLHVCQRMNAADVRELRLHPEPYWLS